MAYGYHRAKSSGKNSDGNFRRISARSTNDWLLVATDVSLWLTMVATAIGFGGRMASGQLALVIGASVTSFCWMLHLLTTKEARYAWTGSEWLWLSGILVAIIQIVDTAEPAERQFQIEQYLRGEFAAHEQQIESELTESLPD